MAVGPGVVLARRYALRSLIATGGMGQVWRAEDTTLHRQVAVKVLRSEYTGDPTFLARFRAEARNTAALSHANIASVYDYGEEDQDGEELAYLVMELVEGEPLSELLRREGRLNSADTLAILGQAAAGLDAAHRAGVVHRDVKPGNVLLRPDGLVKITDFGIARAGSATALTQTGMVVGTAHYLSPEQAEGRLTTPASDVYSLGVVGYECLAGRRPFNGDTSVVVALQQIRDIAPALPPNVPGPTRGLIDRAMAKDPRLRFPTGGEFATAIRAVEQGRPVPPGPGVGPAVGSGIRTQMIDGAPGVVAGVGAAGIGAKAGGLAADGRPATSILPAGAPPRSAVPAGVGVAGPPRRGSGAIWLAIVVALLVLAALIGVIVAKNLGGTGGITTTTTTGAPTATTAQSSTTSSTTVATTPSATTPSATTPATAVPPPTTTAAKTTTPPPTTTATTATTVSTVTVDSALYVGQPLADVTASLEGMGLVVDPKAKKPPNGEPDGTVLSISPDGEVPVGSTITVTYAMAKGNAVGSDPSGTPGIG